MKCPIVNCKGTLNHVRELDIRGYSTGKVWCTFVCDCCEAQLKC